MAENQIKLSEIQPGLCYFLDNKNYGMFLFDRLKIDTDGSWFTLTSQRARGWINHVDVLILAVDKNPQISRSLNDSVVCLAIINDSIGWLNVRFDHELPEYDDGL